MWVKKLFENEMRLIYASDVSLLVSLPLLLTVYEASDPASSMNGFVIFWFVFVIVMYGELIAHM